VSHARSLAVFASALDAKPAAQHIPPSKRAIMGLPQTGGRPGSAGMDSTLARMASEIGWM